MIAYYDTSALVKRYDPNEVSAAAIVDRLGARSGVAYTSTLARVEVFSGFRTKQRSGAFDASLVAAAVELFEAHAETQYSFLQVADSVVAEAARLVMQHKLRAYDAVHIATALALCSAMSARKDDVEFVTSDADQARAAAAEGLRVVMP